MTTTGHILFILTMKGSMRVRVIKRDMKKAPSHCLDLSIPHSKLKKNLVPVKRNVSEQNVWANFPIFFIKNRFKIKFSNIRNLSYLFHNKITKLVLPVQKYKEGRNYNSDDD